MKEIDVSSLKKIGEGLSGEVFGLDEEKVIKRYFPTYPYEKIEDEFTKSRLLYEAGVRTPKPYEIVKSQDCFGTIFQRMRGKELLEEFAKEKDKASEYGRRFGTLSRQLHEIEGNPSLKSADSVFQKGYEASLYLIPEEDRDRIKKLISIFPSGNSLLHGDLQPGNVMLEDGELYLIDTALLMRGFPVMDLLQPYAFAMLWPKLADIASAMTEKDRTQNPELYRHLHRYESKCLPTDEGKIIWKSFVEGYFGDGDEKILDKLTYIVVVYNALKLILAGYMSFQFSDALVRGMSAMGMSMLPKDEDLVTKTEEYIHDLWNI